MRLAPGYVLCACGWHGKAGAKTPCPACNRPAIDRIDDGRLAALRLVRNNPRAPLLQSQASRMIQIGVIARTSPRVPPGDSGKRHVRPPRRAHRVTELGDAALAAAASFEQQRAATTRSVTGEHEGNPTTGTSTPQAQGAQAGEA